MRGSIEEQLERRDEVHEEIVDELESKLDWYKDRLESLYKQSRGRNGEREQLKQRISSFYRQLREEKQQHWRGRQELEQERRDLLRELNENEETEFLENLF